VYKNRLSEQLANLKAMYEIPVIIIEDEPKQEGFGKSSLADNPSVHHPVNTLFLSIYLVDQRQLKSKVFWPHLFVNHRYGSYSAKIKLKQQNSLPTLCVAKPKRAQ
jgi:hypothetical protein